MLPFIKGKRAGLPKRVRSPTRVLIHTCAGGGWRTQHVHRNCSFLCFGSFFLTQVRQVKVVFLRTLRNAATRLLSTIPVLPIMSLFIATTIMVKQMRQPCALGHRCVLSIMHVSVVWHAWLSQFFGQDSSLRFSIWLFCCVRLTTSTHDIDFKFSGVKECDKTRLKT